MKLIRWKVTLHKLCKVLGHYQNIERNERFALMTAMFTLYVQGFAHKEEELSEVDVRALEDVLTVAVEVMNDVRQFDPSVLNPINFI